MSGCEKITVKFLFTLFIECLSPGVLVQCQAQQGAKVLLRILESSAEW